MIQVVCSVFVQSNEIQERRDAHKGACVYEETEPAMRAPVRGRSEICL
jgi:hypothetical protein